MIAPEKILGATAELLETARRVLGDRPTTTDAKPSPRDSSRRSGRRERGGRRTR